MRRRFPLAVTAAVLDHVVRCFASTATALGPRVYVLGTRVHEWHLGAALLLGARRRARLLDRVDDGFTTAAAIAAGLWLVAKDWRDLFPAQRDTRVPGGWACTAGPLRCGPFAARDPLPKLAALVTALAGRRRTSPPPSRPTSPGATTCSCTSRRSRP